MSAKNITIRIDEDLKKQAEELFNDLGMNMTTAYIMFLKQAIREQRIPFVISRNPTNTISESFEQRFYRELSCAQEQIDKGDTVDGEEVLKRLRTKYGY